MKTHSVGKNAILNMLRVLVSLLFPLITFPYVSRVLQVENLGRVTYANSIITYFALFATLGVKTYATREGAALRENRETFQQFFSQVFSITILTTLGAYLVLFAMIFQVDALQEYRGLLIVLSISMLLTTLGTEWVCSAYEDYTYITIRSIAFQALACVLLLLFVRDQNDVYQYAVILVVSSAGSNILNLFYVRRYCRLRLTVHMKLRTHMKPILILFASNLATCIYVSSDVTLLGVFCGDYYTGLYSVSTKIYSIVKNLISAIILVAIPRFSYYYGKGMTDKFNELLAAISGHLAIIALPASVGMFLVSDLIVTLLSGASYAPAATSLRILSLAVLFVAVSWVLAQGVLVPMKQENYVLKITLCAVAINVGLNFLLIPLWKQNAAAWTTLLAETFIAAAYVRKVWGMVHPAGVLKEIGHAGVGSVAVIIWVLVSRHWLTADIPALVMSVVGGIACYAITLLILRDSVMYGVLTILCKKCREVSRLLGL